MGKTYVSYELSIRHFNRSSIAGFGSCTDHEKTPSMSLRVEPRKETVSPAGVDPALESAEESTDIGVKSATARFISSSQAAREPSRIRVEPYRSLSIISTIRTTIASTTIRRPAMDATTRAHTSVTHKRWVFLPARQTSNQCSS